MKRSTMNKLSQEIRRLRVSRSLGIIALTLAPGWALSANLENIHYQKQSDGSVTVLFQLNEPLSGQPSSFQIDNPARVAIDLPEVTNRTGSYRSDVDINMIRSLTLADAGDKTRAVFNLSQSGPYEIKVRDNLVAVQFHEAKKPVKTDAGTPISSPGDIPAATMD
ncbi:MAG TPA: AMIN domain-containing protein, partial [Halothiobacillaceae bacterium]|nr:AMIN domain-containing protein [Halothiobacillaceae bacterium]